MKILLFTLVLPFLTISINAQNIDVDTKFEDAVPVLNFGTFHMGYTPDATKTEFDEHNQDNVREVHKLAAAIAEFKPTVIIVETGPKYDEKLQKEYEEYIKNPQMKFDHPSEVELLAYEVGRLANTSRIYGVDYKEMYNYRIADYVENSKDSETYYRYMKMISYLEKEFSDKNMPLKARLKLTNDPKYLDMLINVNADMLTHISSEGKSQGADEASKYYHRNLVMYSNINQIELTGKDRVFVLMGASHTAFFNMWMKRSPKYKLIDVFQYLN